MTTTTSVGLLLYKIEENISDIFFDPRAKSFPLASSQLNTNRGLLAKELHHRSAAWAASRTATGKVSALRIRVLSWELCCVRYAPHRSDGITTALIGIKALAVSDSPAPHPTPYPQTELQTYITHFCNKNELHCAKCVTFLNILIDEYCNHAARPLSRISPE